VTNFLFARIFEHSSSRAYLSSSSQMPHFRTKTTIDTRNSRCSRILARVHYTRESVHFYCASTWNSTFRHEIDFVKSWITKRPCILLHLLLRSTSKSTRLHSFIVIRCIGWDITYYSSRICKFSKFGVHQNFGSRTLYMGISTFLLCFHVECLFLTSNRLHQKAELRKARAHANSSKLDEYRCALPLRSSEDWMSYCVFNSYKNRYRLLDLEYFLEAYKIKSGNGRLPRGRPDRYTT
jgi:hypothetical protein